MLWGILDRTSRTTLCTWLILSLPYSSSQRLTIPQGKAPRNSPTVCSLSRLSLDFRVMTGYEQTSSLEAGVLKCRNSRQARTTQSLGYEPNSSLEAGVLKCPNSGRARALTTHSAGLHKMFTRQAAGRANLPHSMAGESTRNTFVHFG